MKLYRISLMLNPKGFHWAEKEYEAKESAKTFVAVNEDGVRKVVKAASIMQLSSVFNASHTCVEFRTWCHESQIAEAKIMLEEKVREVANRIKKEAEEMFKWL